MMEKNHLGWDKVHFSGYECSSSQKLQKGISAQLEITASYRSPFFPLPPVFRKRYLHEIVCICLSTQICTSRSLLVNWAEFNDYYEILAFGVGLIIFFYVIRAIYNGNLPPWSRILLSKCLMQTWNTIFPLPSWVSPSHAPAHRLSSSPWVLGPLPPPTGRQAKSHLPPSPTYPHPTLDFLSLQGHRARSQWPWDGGQSTSSPISLLLSKPVPFLPPIQVSKQESSALSTIPASSSPTIPTPNISLASAGKDFSVDSLKRSAHRETGFSFLFHSDSSLGKGPKTNFLQFPHLTSDLHGKSNQLLIRLGWLN